MNCWKTINLSKDYGFHRLFFLSIFTAVIAFIILYLCLQLMFSSNNLEDHGLIYVLICAVLLFPLRQFIHYVVLRIVGKKVNVHFQKKGIFPIITIKQSQLLSKNIAILTILSPIFIVTTILLGLSILLPHYLHFFSMLTAVNIGFCMRDLLYGFQFIKAPKQCFMEENSGGYDILIHKS